jgi:Transcriptional regulators
MADIGDKESIVLFNILEIISGGDEPLGAGAICDALADRRIATSEAAVGRALRKFRNRGLLERRGFQGHVITPAGEALLSELTESRTVNAALQRLLSDAVSSYGHSLHDVLIARRALEREATVQAVFKASAEDLARLEAIVRRQYDKMARGEEYTEESGGFHREILRIAHVPLLETMYDFIGLTTPWQNFFIGTMQVYKRSAINATHERILEAIAARDPDLAGMLMCEHIDDVIAGSKHFQQPA